MNPVWCLAALAFVAGCGAGSAQTTAAPSPVSETTRVTTTIGGTSQIVANQSITAARAVIKADVDHVWAVLPAVFDTLGIPVTVANTATHQLGNGGFDVRQKLGTTMVTRYFDCGAGRGGSSALSYDLFVTALTTLEAAGGTTNVSTIVEVKGKPITYSGDWVHCSSNGVLEQKIIDAINARLK